MTDIAPEIFINILERSIEQKDPRGFLQDLLDDKNYSFTPEQANLIEDLIENTKGLSNDREALIIDNAIDDLKMRALASQVQINTGYIEENATGIADNAEDLQQIRQRLEESATALLEVTQNVEQNFNITVENRAIIVAQQQIIQTALTDLRPDVTIGDINIDNSVNSHNTDVEVDIDRSRHTTAPTAPAQGGGSNGASMQQQLQIINTIINSDYDIEFPNHRAIGTPMEKGGR